MNDKKTKNVQSPKNSEIALPPIIFGTSGLGNLFVALDEKSKCDILKEYVGLSNGPMVFDTAGKYGAGLALEVLGNCLRHLKVSPKNVIISNKLGWVRTELKTVEPTFEPGVWKELKYDAVQKISYDGILECFEQGNELLGGYVPDMLSVHDPDEYVDAAATPAQAQQRYEDILDAYEALFDLKRQGKVKAIGVGAKDWTIIRRIAGDVSLDWVMIANSMTIKSHPEELRNFMAELNKNGIMVINSAVFHSGFLTGGDYFDYKLLERGKAEHEALFQWREAFFAVCEEYGVTPAAACVQFAFLVPAVKSVALNTTDVRRVKENLALAEAVIPPAFWEALRAKKLIAVDFLAQLQPVS